MKGKFKSYSKKKKAFILALGAVLFLGIVTGGTLLAFNASSSNQHVAKVEAKKVELASDKDIEAIAKISKELKDNEGFLNEAEKIEYATLETQFGKVNKKSTAKEVEKLSKETEY